MVNKNIYACIYIYIYIYIYGEVHAIDDDVTTVSWYCSRHLLPVGRSTVTDFRDASTCTFARKNRRRGITAVAKVIETSTRTDATSVSIRPGIWSRLLR